MADTSLKNSKCMYKQQQKSINKQFSHNSWKYKCISENTAFPCAGINMPMMTNGYNNNILTNNAPDIESLLFGIGSSNLVKPKDKVTPQYNCIDNIKFFNTMETIIPEPMIIERSQRPNGPFC
tara:strand:- start:544 stop:912 length:369 start_codon:yes stop_codon:yes gene_type:complete